MLDFVDTTTDFVLAIVFVIAALLTIQTSLQRMAFARAGKNATGGESWIWIAIISGVVLAVINR